mmetsp:Transcript_19128/g.53540  ORF Transcript_19128/g.53540 Transcript_19128/m.53540 type:complete len:471 (+) Transcript_19128:160-1572(+)|eukprot:CAMPEP_0202381142 /NCGR_PEP_ID=MMETSP1127-20130417/33427_1 /ASSEMBLY_ACC=CAM_ASM_000462 /TAXON_ID=3047 /ORGANISM="Dunaliella tertiolecta, Strain CCMP1320" /LENGTH=470 /DNA_ID=CAMNT_0048980013 /DNA_START=152 /DNA_END=1564 /DNA_ORIENTATION=-
MLSWWKTGAEQPAHTLSPAVKLRGFYEIAKEALERAYSCDCQGDVQKALRSYDIALQAIEEALLLPVLGNGLGPRADNVSSQKHDLAIWQQSAKARVKYLRNLGSVSQRGAPPPPVKPVANTSILISRPPASKADRGVVQHARMGAGQLQMQEPPKGAMGNWGATNRAASSEEQKYRDLISNEILDASPGVSWDSIADLQVAKRTLHEAVVLPALRPDLFSGPLRSPCRGILLYGPPGNGKTLLGKALASEAGTCFFSISASSLTSKWVGEGEKLVRALFALAAEKAPSIIFIDEIDSLLSSRGGGNEHDAARRLKTEFLVQFDGVAAAPGSERVVVVGATNRPQELDDAVRRRLVKRIYIPLPNAEGRAAILSHLLKGQPHLLRSRELGSIVQVTEGYSASDLTALTKEAAMGPIREVPSSALVRIPASALRPIAAKDFMTAMQIIKPSTDARMLAGYEEFTRAFGTGG